MREGEQQGVRDKERRIGRGESEGEGRGSRMGERR